MSAAAVAEEAAQRAHTLAPGFVGDDRWVEKDCPLDDVRVWRLPQPRVIAGASPEGFKMQGVVRGVSPRALALGLTGDSIVGHHESEGRERRLVAQIDAKTKIWFDVDPYPKPMVARERLYVESWAEAEDGKITIVEMPIELPEEPVGRAGWRSRVRAEYYEVKQLEATTGGTRATIASEVKTGAPDKLVNFVLNLHTHHFGHLSKAVAEGHLERFEEQIADSGGTEPPATNHNYKAPEPPPGSRRYADAFTAATQPAKPQPGRGLNLDADYRRVLDYRRMDYRNYAFLSAKINPDKYGVPGADSRQGGGGVWAGCAVLAVALWLLRQRVAAVAARNPSLRRAIVWIARPRSVATIGAVLLAAVVAVVIRRAVGAKRSTTDDIVAKAAQAAAAEESAGGFQAPVTAAS